MADEVPQGTAVSSTTLGYLRALDPADPHTAAHITAALVQLDRRMVDSEEAAAIYAEVRRIRRAIRQLHHTDWIPPSRRIAF